MDRVQIDLKRIKRIPMFYGYLFIACYLLIILEYFTHTEHTLKLN